MSGGIAYVLADDMDEFKALCNTEMIEFEITRQDRRCQRSKEMI